MTRFDNLPQSPRPAGDDRVIQLDHDDIGRIFQESIPSQPRLPPEAARIATMMAKAGRDAGAIALRIGASPAAVSAFLERLAAARPAKAAKPDEPAPMSPESFTTAASAAEPEPPAAQQRTPLVRTMEEAPPWDPRRDVELTPLQAAMIRNLRKLRIPALTIARLTRVAPDQISRIAGEAP